MSTHKKIKIYNNLLNDLTEPSPFQKITTFEELKNQFKHEKYLDVLNCKAFSEYSFTDISWNIIHKMYSLYLPNSKTTKFLNQSSDYFEKLNESKRVALAPHQPKRKPKLPIGSLIGLGTGLGNMLGSDSGLGGMEGMENIMGDLMKNVDISEIAKNLKDIDFNGIISKIVDDPNVKEMMSNFDLSDISNISNLNNILQDLEKIKEIEKLAEEMKKNLPTELVDQIEKLGKENENNTNENNDNMDLD